MDISKKYDVFISYRRVGGDKYARTIQQALEKRYKVFLDFDELKDGVFDERIMSAIKEAPVFLLILSKGALDRCVNEGDWVREEILYADKCHSHIVPVTVDDTFEGLPVDLPKEVKEIVGAHQFSELQMKTLFKASIEELIQYRIEPYVEHDESKDGKEIHIETDTDCNMYRFKMFVKQLKAGEDNIVYLKPGKYKLDFISVKYHEVSESLVYTLNPDMDCDFLVVSLKEKVDFLKKQKAEEDERLKSESEAVKRRADEKEQLKVEKEKEPERTEPSIETENSDIYNEAESYTWRWVAAIVGLFVILIFIFFPSTCDSNQATSIDMNSDVGIDSIQVMSEYEQGMDYYNDGNYEEAIEHFRIAADEGDANAQFKLGMMYSDGEGLEQSYKDAAEWYRKAAEQGDAAAQCNLGVMYQYGKGVEQSNKDAVEWYSKSAEQGIATAQCNLGYMYKNGLGIKQDYKKAIEWYLKAAEQDDDNGQCNLGNMFYDGLGVKQNYIEALNWYLKASEKGNASAQYNLGNIYCNGLGVKQNYKEAIEWYRKAAEQGNAPAQYNLAVMYENGDGVAQNKEEAKKWYRKAADQGDEDAKRALASMK